MSEPLTEKDVLDAVRERAVKLTRYPLALFAVCSLCEKRTDSFSLRRMDPEPQHERDCPLWQSR
jgi:hypothetical protein